MQKRSAVRWCTAAFFMIIALELIGEALVELASAPMMVFITKPLMMPALAAMYYFSLRGRPPAPWHRYIFGALFFSWMGDLLLMVTWTGENLFLYGLAAFLIAHLLYINGFRLTVSGKPAFLRKAPYAALPVLLYVAGLIYSLNQLDTGEFSEMKMPVILYAGVIMVMVLASLNRYKRVGYPSFILVLLGALLFMFSDSLIAVNKFTETMKDSPILVRVLIMSTYAVGQFLIVKGILRQADSK